MDFSLKAAIQRLIFLFALFAGLYFAKPFLVPVAFGALLAMLLLPVALRLEKKMNRALAVLLCIAGLILILSGIIALLSWQVSDMAGNAAKMEQQVMQMINTVKQQISTSLGISPQKQQQMLQQQQQSGGGGLSGGITHFLQSFVGMLGNFVLVLVYIFLFLYFRNRLKGFILRKTKTENQESVRDMIDKSQEVAGKYISGLALMIVCLWVLYGIGFTIAGVKGALFFAILCGLLEIIPFIGNITGTAITILGVVAQGGGPEMIIAVAVTYAIVQTFQSYVLEPLIVGANVNINPLFTIMVIVLGELLWGVPGMILAIPLLAIAKIICDHVPELQPYGYLFGEDRKKGNTQWVDKIKGWFGRKS